MPLKLFLIVSILAVSGVNFLRPGGEKHQAIYQAPPKNLVNFHFDYADMISSTFWVRLLQDIEICDQRSDRELPEVLEGGENVVEQILSRDLPPAKCRLSWVYKMVDVITDLSPDFYMAYDVGGLFLSVLVDDREGAQRIYQKGIQYFPDEWQLLYKASYHSLFEMQKPGEAAQLLLQAARNGGPQWLYSLAARLYSKVGRAQFAHSILKKAMDRGPKGYHAERIERRLHEIESFLKKQTPKQ